MTGRICIIFTTTILGVHIFHYYSSNSITSNPRVFKGVNNFCLRSVAHAHVSVGSCQPQSADVCLLVQTCSFDMCVCGAVYALSRIFSPFSLSEHYYIVQYRRKNMFSCRRNCQLLCCHSAPLLWTCLFFNTCFRYFSLHFLM